MKEIREGNPNRERLTETARRLAPLLKDLVFLGGTIVDLLITDSAAFRTRPTDDVDAIVSCTSRVEYDALLGRLRQLGFQPDTRADAPICRTITADGYVLDVMPLDEGILGFSNRWYPLVIERAQSIQLAPDLTVRIAIPTTFFLSKWEAFQVRGTNDPLGSHDLEDLIMLTAGRRELPHEIVDLPEEAKVFLASAMRAAMAKTWFRDAIEGALPDARTIPGLVPIVHQHFEAMLALLTSRDP